MGDEPELTYADSVIRRTSRRAHPSSVRRMSHNEAEAMLQLCSGFLTARSLQVVAEFGIADLLDDQPRTASELAAEVAVDPDALHRVLRLLAAHGVFAPDGDSRWRHTAASRLLRSDHPTSLRAFVRLSGLPHSWQSLAELPHTIRTGEAGIRVIDPEGIFAYFAAHPDEQAIFQQAMVGKAHGDIAAVLAAYDFSQHDRIADIGGGRGHLLAAILDRHPKATGTLFELPAVAATIEPRPRCTVVGGDFFTDPLPAADAYLLMDIIHDWDDESATAILRAVADAGRASAATVLLVEAVLPEGPGPHWALTLDVWMLAVTGGRQRSVAEYRAMLADAGIDLVGVTPTATAFSIVEGRVREGDTR